ncbi:MAG: hypothetical protein V4543_12500 [Bacteroidota bacterium]
MFIYSKSFSVLIIICLLAAVLESKAQSQQAIPSHEPAVAQKRGVVKLDPFAVLIPGLGVAYERVLDSSKSLQVSTYIGAAESNLFTDGKPLGFAVGIMPELRFYVGDAPAPKGFYLGPLAGLAYSSGGFLPSRKATTIMAGAVIGYQWVLKKGIVIDLSGGPAIGYNKVGPLGPGEYSNETSGIIYLPNLRLNVGYAF